MSRDVQDNLLSMHYALTMSLGGGDTTTTAAAAAAAADTTNAAASNLGPLGKKEYQRHHLHQYNQEQQTLQQQHSQGHSNLSQLNSSDWAIIGNTGSNTSSVCFSDSVATWGGGATTGTAGGGGGAGGHLETSHLGAFSFLSPADDAGFGATAGDVGVGFGGNAFNQHHHHHHQGHLEDVAEDISPLVSGDPSSYLGFRFSLPTDIIQDNHHHAE